MTKVLIIGYVWPEPRSSAAGARMMDLIRLFLQQGWQVTFASPAQLGEHREDLGVLGVAEQQIELNAASFDVYVRELQPDIVLFDRFMMEEQFGWRVEAQCPDAVRILDTEDLHSLRDARHRLLKQFLKEDEALAVERLCELDWSQLYQAMTLEDHALREVASIYRCDLSLMISDFEIALLNQGFGVPPDLLHHCPLMLAPAPTVWKGFNEREHFISIGNFRHAPNWDAVLWLKQEIWPRIRRQLPQAQLHVYGAYPPPKATDLHNPQQGLLVKGWAKDSLAVMGGARVCLAPLRFGAGIKGKLSEAMWCGTPSVTTPIGTEAMRGDFDWSGSVATRSETFADAAVQLYQEPGRWTRAQENGRNLLDTRFAGGEIGNSLVERISELRVHLPERRRKNFTGLMLRHHLHKSTRYMAKWIEAKNRLKDFDHS